MWIYLRCRDNKLWFEREITTKEGTKYIHFGDPEILESLYQNLDSFSVRGGRGAGIIIHSIKIPDRLTIKVVALREDWNNFSNRKNSYLVFLL